jgi:hypothetical protein
LPATVRGVWVHEGQRYEEEFIRLFVDVPDTRANRQFFIRLKATLLKRFQATRDLHCFLSCRHLVTQSRSASARDAAQIRPFLAVGALGAPALQHE